jgi:uncharacterized membrane protein YjjP (DUF1212 family)
VSKETIQTELSSFKALIETSSALKLEIDKSKLTITETIITKKYDKDTGTIIEETKTERKATQDSDKVVSEETNQAVTNSNQLEVDHFREDTEKVDSEVTEESIGGQEAFGRWFGIVTACFIGLFLLYLWKKFRVS